MQTNQTHFQQAFPAQTIDSHGQSYGDLPHPVIMNGTEPQRRKQSGLGITSLIMSLLIGVIMIGAVFYAGYLESTTPGGINEDDPVAVLVGLAILGGMFGNLIGIVLAAVGLSIRERVKTVSLLGLCFNLLSLIAVGGLMVIGLLAG